MGLQPQVMVAGPAALTVVPSACRIPCWPPTRGVAAAQSLSQPHLSQVKTSECCSPLSNPLCSCTPRDSTVSLLLSMFTLFHDLMGK